MYFRVQSQLSKHHRTHQMNTDYHDFMQTMDFSGKHWSRVTTKDFPGNERDSSPWCAPISEGSEMLYDMDTELGSESSEVWCDHWRKLPSISLLKGFKPITEHRPASENQASSIKGFIFWHLSTKRCHTDVNIHNYMLKLSGAVKILLVLCRVLLRGQDPLRAGA